LNTHNSMSGNTDPVPTDNMDDDPGGPMTDTPHTPTQSDEIEPISATEARAILQAAIAARLGPDWEDDGWIIADRGDYTTRLNRGKINMDFYVDLLGEVTVEENDINPAQEYGRLLASSFIIGSVIIAIVLARIAGAI